MPDLDSELRELVRRYRVTWQTRHEMAPSGHSVAPVGYVIELNAVPEDPAQAAHIASPDGGLVEVALERIARGIASSEVIHVGRGTRVLAGTHDTEPEAPATVTVLHQDGGGINRPPDEREHERLAVLVDRLRSLGAQEGHWRDEATK